MEMSISKNETKHFLRFSDENDGQREQIEFFPFVWTETHKAVWKFAAREFQ